jgi:hypothetical protein
MKIAFAALMIVVTAPAIAQTAPAPAPAPASSAPAPTPAPAGKLSLDTPLEIIVANPEGKKVLLADLGTDVTQIPSYDSFKGMSLTQLAPISGGKLTDDEMKKLATDLAAIQ